VRSRKHDQGRLIGCARDLSSCDEIRQAALCTALADTRVNGLHAGRSRAGQKNDSALPSEELRLTRKHEDPARS
jgi:hypothetical protein